MGLSGSHLRQRSSIEDKISRQDFLPGFVNYESNGISPVDIAMLIVGAISFAFALVGIALSCGQFKGRRGEYSGKGSGAWLVVGFVLLLLSGAWTGVASAYTAYSVQKMFSFSRGPAYSEPFTIAQKLYLRNIASYVARQTTQELNFSSASQFVDESYLGEWGQVNTIDQANALLGKTNYLHYIFSYKAAVAVSWVMLGSTFFTMVVHFALPWLWKCLGFVREPEKKKDQYNEF